MKIIGVTGAIGVGKSTVSGILADKLSPSSLLSVQKIKYRLLQKHEIQEAVKVIFKITDVQGNLSSETIKSLYYSSPCNYKAINTILYPYIIGELKDKIHTLVETDYIIVECGQLYEYYINEVIRFDLIIEVHAEPDVRIKRLKDKHFNYLNVISLDALDVTLNPDRLPVILRMFNDYDKLTLLNEYIDEVIISNIKML